MGELLLCMYGRNGKKNYPPNWPGEGGKVQKRPLPGWKTQNPGRNYTKRDKEMKETV